MNKIQIVTSVTLIFTAICTEETKLVSKHHEDHNSKAMATLGKTLSSSITLNTLYDDIHAANKAETFKSYHTNIAVIKSWMLISSHSTPGV
jgi:uncharacterized membrane protein